MYTFIDKLLLILIFVNYYHIDKKKNCLYFIFILISKYIDKS